MNSKRNRFSAVFALFLAFFTIQAEAQSSTSDTDSVFSSVDKPQEEVKQSEEPFDTGDFILHHIADAHEFHILGEGHNAVSLPLPVILWTDNGLVSFMSSAFHHDDEGKEVVERKGQRFVKFHGKIYYASPAANGEGGYVDLDEKKHALNAMPLDFSITKNVFSLLFSVVVLSVLFISVGRAYVKRAGKAPKGFQSLIEPVILFVRDDIAKPNLGYKYEKFMPYLLTVFFFIWFNNMLGLVPFFPGSANVTGNIAVTMVLALCTLVLTVFNGNKYYWKHIFMPPVPWWMYPIMVPVEIVGIFTKPIALMIRLFANITAGHILMLSLICLIFIFKNIMIAPIAVPFAVFISLIELLVAFIQAFIFTILSALFIGMAIEEHQDH
ncbi:MAG TPA: F0F1 ATP synthase subunit A [Sphingobacteriaceae bacterium]